MAFGRCGSITDQGTLRVRSCGGLNTRISCALELRRAVRSEEHSVAEMILENVTYERLGRLEDAQNAVVGALGIMLKSLQLQTNMLTELVDAARADPGESPVVQALEQLTTAVVQMGAGVQILSRQVEDLPETVQAVLSPQPAPAP